MYIVTIDNQSCSLNKNKKKVIKLKLSLSQLENIKEWSNINNQFGLSIPLFTIMLYLNFHVSASIVIKKVKHA